MRLKWLMLQRDYQRIGNNVGVKNIRDIIFLTRRQENQHTSTQRKLNNNFRQPPVSILQNVFRRYMKLTPEKRILECFKSWDKYHMIIPDTNIFLNHWDFVEFLMKIPHENATIYILQVVMKELDQREKGNVPGISADDRK